jgi:hypothetical protein
MLKLGILMDVALDHVVCQEVVGEYCCYELGEGVGGWSAGFNFSLIEVAYLEQ